MSRKKLQRIFVRVGTAGHGSFLVPWKKMKQKFNARENQNLQVVN